MVRIQLSIFKIVKTIAKLHLIRGGGAKKTGGGPCDFRRTEPCTVHIGTRLDPNGPKQTLKDQMDPNRPKQTLQDQMDPNRPKQTLQDQSRPYRTKADRTGPD